jgi:hypothetical protein
MDYADGGDLSGAISRRKKSHSPFSESEVMNMFVQICLALKHVHYQKILHRDLKAQNIFLTKKGVVKLGDFGIAKVLDSTGDVARTQIGTPYYLSPEICEDKPYGKKSDVWSLGCVLYEIAALDLPFQARNLPALAHRIMTKEPAALPASHRYSEDLKNLTKSLLNKKPDRRPSVVTILRSPFVQGHISDLLSHTIQAKTGGMERDAVKDSDASSAAAAANPNPRGPSPIARGVSNQPSREPPSAAPVARDVSNGPIANVKKFSDLSEKDKKAGPQVPPRPAGRNRDMLDERRREQSRQDAIEREQIREAKMRELQALQAQKRAALIKHQEQQKQLERERAAKVRERERDAMRKVRADMEKRRLAEEVERWEQEGNAAAQANAPRGRGPSVLKDWVGVGPPAVGEEKPAAYEGRDGWMYREQDKLEADILEAKREFESQQRQKPKPAAGGSAWDQKRAAAIAAMKQQQAASNQGYQQRQLQEQIAIAGPGFNGGGFADPAKEWEWRRAQAAKNRNRVEDDLGRKAAAAGAGGGDRDRFDERAREIDSRLEKERIHYEQQKQQMRAQEEARAVFFQNRQMAAAIKSRHEAEERAERGAAVSHDEMERRKRKGSSVEEVRRSKEMQKEIEEQRKKQEHDEAFRQVQAERLALAQKLAEREEVAEVIPEKLVMTSNDFGTINTDIVDFGAAGGGGGGGGGDGEGYADGDGEVNELAAAYANALILDDEDQDDDENEDLMDDPLIRTSLECAEDGEDEEKYEDDDEEEDEEEEKAADIQDSIHFSPMKKRGKSNVSAESKEDEIEQMEELVRSLKAERLSRENSKVADSDEEEDEVLIGGNRGLMMPPNMLAEAQISPPVSPTKAQMRQQKAEAKESDFEPRADIMVSPPPGVALEIDMSPAVGKLKENEMEKKREALRIKQEQRVKLREDARKKAKDDEARERQEVMRKMKEAGREVDAAREAAKEAMRESAREAESRREPKVLERRKKKGWGSTTDRDKMMVVESLSRAGGGGDFGAGGGGIGEIKGIGKLEVGKSNGEGIDTLVGRLEEMRMDLVGGKDQFRLNRKPSAASPAPVARHQQVASRQVSASVDSGLPRGDSFIRRARERREGVRVEEVFDDDVEEEKEDHPNNPFRKVLS